MCMLRKLRGEFGDRLRKWTSLVLLRVPGAEIDLVQKAVDFVRLIEVAAVQGMRIPLEQDTPEIKDDGFGGSWHTCDCIRDFLADI